MDHFLLLGDVDGVDLVPHGGPVGLLAHVEVALGRISVQVLQGRRLFVHSIFV